MSRITISDIKVEFPICCFELLTLKITASVNNHGYLEYSGRLEKEEAEKITNFDYYKESVCIYFGETLGFCGLPLSVIVSERNQAYILKVNAVSFSYLLTFKKYNYFYQDVNQNYVDVLRKSLDCENGDIIATKGKSLIPSPILQYNETPWNFSLRIAGKIGTVITPNILSDTPQICLGLPNGSIVSITSNSVTKRRHLFEKTQNVEKYNSISSNGYYQYEFEHEQILRLGETVALNKDALTIVSLCCELKNSEIMNHYVLGEGTDLVSDQNCNPLQTGLILNGTVIDVKGEHVKVCLGIPDDAENGKEQAAWFEYATEVSNGMYSVPPKGTMVNLKWQSSEDGDIKAIHAVRDGSDLAENPYKSFGTEYKNGLSMTPRRVAFSSDSNIIKLKKGVRFNTFKNIEIHAQKNIKITSNKTMNLKTPEEVIVAKSDALSSVVMSAREIDIKSATTTVCSYSESGIEKPVRKGIRKIILTVPEVAILDASTPKV